jgi:hypothetical protein
MQFIYSQYQKTSISTLLGHPKIRLKCQKILITCSTFSTEICFISIIVNGDYSRHGNLLQQQQQIPTFAHEPPSHVIFSNNTGSKIACTAHGSPIPLITWLTRDGNIVSTVPGLR